MKILAIDTSTMLGGVAIMEDSSGLIAEVRLNVKSTHSERLMTTINSALRLAAITLQDIDAFAVAIGPGSFTGLRIALSTVKGLSYATRKPIISVPTFEALAWHFPYCRYPVCTMLDARKKEVYVALFQWENNRFIRLIDETSIKISEFLERFDKDIASSHERIIFTGEGALLYRERIIEVMGKKALFASPEKMIPSPANVAYIGMKKALKGEFSEPIRLTPLYIRKSEAEIRWG
jgi:tRNA threonylcarbamoyladenosine biosynthesis protein TsaB